MLKIDLSHVKKPLLRKSLENVHQKIDEVNFKKERSIWDPWISKSNEGKSHKDISVVI